MISPAGLKPADPVYTYYMSPFYLFSALHCRFLRLIGDGNEFPRNQPGIPVTAVMPSFGIVDGMYFTSVGSM